MEMPRPLPTLPAEVEDYRDERWCRDVTRLVQTPIQAEQLVERVGFAACMIDSRRPGPSLYVAVCGRRDAVMPRNVQTDEEASLAWTLKDDLLRRGRVYYAKLARKQAMFLAPRMIPYFNAVWGLRKADEPHRLGTSARAGGWRGRQRLAGRRKQRARDERRPRAPAGPEHDHEQRAQHEGGRDHQQRPQLAHAQRRRRGRQLELIGEQ